ncbi:uncharacterized protein LOC122670575 [Telopea speciosissima]|uniref:uncharacterized protein LOC122670575 n=1 Tax=Telopea speciosissima TaxID=54955 RepID=UPI001CC45D1A|nr:uncharacterized protein LOC122670575 [Telopea speciosissima]
MHEAIIRNWKRKREVFDNDYDVGYTQGELPAELETGEQMQSNVCRSPTRESQASSRFTLVPNFGTAAKRNKAVMDAQVRGPIDAYIKRIPKEVVVEGQAEGHTRTTIEKHFVSNEERKRACSYIAKWFYDCGIPFNAAKARSFEEMVEAIGQFGPGLEPPSYYELSVPFLNDEKDGTKEVKKKYEEYWKTYGCTVMCDGWTDERGRHLINFLVNCPKGTYFMGSIDASNQVQDANMLFQLLDSKIEEIGADNVVQIVTDNVANYVTAGKLLLQKRSRLYWTPCAARCLDHMLEDIGNLRAFRAVKVKARRITSFIYRHPRLLEAIKTRTNGDDLVRVGVTRFATSFLTLQSLLKYNSALMRLFVCDDWNKSKLSKTEIGKKVEDTVLATKFWNGVRDCLRASQPILVVLKLILADEKPAMPEIYVAMEVAKKRIKQNFGNRESLWKKVITIVDKQWECQMEQPLYATAFCLNAGKYFEYIADEALYSDQVWKINEAFIDVITRLVPDGTLQDRIMCESDMYKRCKGSFSRQIAIRQRKTLDPLLWWDTNGTSAPTLHAVAMRILGLCCSACGCERNWSTFEFIHTKKRNRLEHQHLNDLAFVQYNRRLQARFQERCAKGNNHNPLFLNELDWSSEWIIGQSVENVVHPGDDPTLGDVDRAVGASTLVGGRNLPRKAQASTSGAIICYTRRGRGRVVVEESSDEGEFEEEYVNDDEDVDDDFGQKPTDSMGLPQQLDAYLFDDYD